MDRTRALFLALVAAIICPAADLPGQVMPPASRDLRERVWDAAPRPTMPIARTNGAIALDGRLAEQAWQTASEFGCFIRTQGMRGNAVWGLDQAEAQTKALVCYDQERLYVGYEVAEPYIDVLKTRSGPHDDGRIWLDDCVELKLDLGRDGKRVLHFIWNSLGRTYDEEDGAGCGGRAWNCEGKQVAAHVDKAGKKWCVEASVPYAGLGVEPPAPGTVWRVSLCRERYASEYRGLQENSAWCGQPERQLSTASRFGEVVFSDLAVREVRVPQAHLGTGTASFRLRSGGPRTVRVSVLSTAKDGEPIGDPKTVKLAAGKETPVALDFRVAEEGTAIVYVTIEDGDTLLACLRRTYYVRPLSQELGNHIERLEAILANSREGSPLAASAESKLAGARKLAAEVAAFVKGQSAKPFTDESRKQWDALGQKANAYSAIGSYVVWSASPWLKVNQKEMPDSFDSKAAVTLEAAQDEIEYGAFMISNLTRSPIAFRMLDYCRVPNLKLLSSPIPLMQTIAKANPLAANLRGEVANPESVGAGHPTSAAPMLTLNEWGEVYVPALSTKRIFVRVDTHGVEPGRYSGQFAIQPLNASYAPARVTIALTVWPFAIPSRTPLSLYLWDYSRSAAHLDDLAAHRVSHFCVNSNPEETAKSTEHVRAKLRRGKLIGSYGIMASFENFAKKRGLKRGTDAYRAAFAKYVTRWVEAVRKAGATLDDVAVQHIDEPYGEAIKKILELGPIVREAQPDLKLVITCMTPFPELQQIAPYCDIYGFRGDVLYEPFKSFLEQEQKKGKQVWSFTCHTPVADRPPLSYWRMRPWWCFKQGFDGIMINLWSNLVHYDWRGPHVAPEPTAGYEALTQGMEDYCLLVMLRDLIGEAEKAGKTKESTAAKAVLDAAVAAVVRKPTAETGEPDLAALLERHRQLIGRQIVALRKTLGEQ